MTSNKDILKQYWGYDSFRGIQEDIINSIEAGKDTLGLMPTGGGKSITFQVPALAMPGVCLVITPLIALMKDQVEHLRSHNIQAAAVYSGMQHQEVIRILENCILGSTKILYVSPERLESNLFKAKLKKIKLSFITVDEAHCICQWGYDFRPSYLKIIDVRKQCPDVPVLALTATATPRVVKEIQSILGFKQENVFKMSFERHNLAYVVRVSQDKMQQLLHILNALPGSSIVYVRSRRHTKEVAEQLNLHHVKATFYHAGLEQAIKDQRQDAWQRGDIRVMVATNAFGMGIDKPDVRSVIHMECPDSIEAYFQEAGRAGRDGLQAYAVLLWNGHDKRQLMKRIDDNFPPKDYIRYLYDKLAYYYQIGINSGQGYSFDFQIDKFCYSAKQFPTRVNSALEILQSLGYIKYDQDPDGKARIRFLLERDDLYKLDNLTEMEEKVVNALLRSYGGLFVDYNYIELGLISLVSGIDEQQVYMVLKTLSHEHIVHFIPQRKTPKITYLRDRVDGEDINITPEVYDIRKERYKNRILSIIDYAENNEICRSQQLLCYFGEFTDHTCGRCDVCVHHSKDYLSTEKRDKMADKIREYLADKEIHNVHDIIDHFKTQELVVATLLEMNNNCELDVNGEDICLK